MEHEILKGKESIHGVLTCEINRLMTDIYRDDKSDESKKGKMVAKTGF
jgi:hypothetical protein